MRKKVNIGFFLISFIGVLLDQVTKLYFYNYFKVIHHNNDYYQHLNNIEVIGDFLQFAYVENAGMAFGIGFGDLKFLLSLFSVFASCVLIWYLYKLRYFDKYLQLGIAFILAGAAGNLIDRVFYGVLFGYAPLLKGRVIDFILVDIPDINFMGFSYSHFPVFNIADSLVTVGVAFLILFHNRIPTLIQLNLAGKEIIENNDIIYPKNLADNSGEE
jgi:signal peptidase II